MDATCARRPTSLAVHVDGVAADDSAARGDASQQAEDNCCYDDARCRAFAESPTAPRLCACTCASNIAEENSKRVSTDSMACIIWYLGRASQGPMQGPASC